MRRQLTYVVLLVLLMSVQAASAKSPPPGAKDIFDDHEDIKSVQSMRGDDIRTLFLMPHAKYTHVSSSMVKEAASLGGSVSEYVPIHVDKVLKNKYGKQ